MIYYILNRSIKYKDKDIFSSYVLNKTGVKLLCKILLGITVIIKVMKYCINLKKKNKINK